MSVLALVFVWLLLIFSLKLGQSYCGFDCDLLVLLVDFFFVCFCKIMAKRGVFL
jgi:hypothetical protein